MRADAITPSTTGSRNCDRYGEAETRALVRDLDAAWAHAPKSLKTWVNENGLANNARIAFAVAHAWRRRRTGQEADE